MLLPRALSEGIGPFHVHVAHQSLKKLFTSACLPTCKDKYHRTSHSPCGSEEAKGKGEEAVHLRPAPAGHTCETGWWVVSIESKTPVCLLRDAAGLFPPFACHNIQIRQGGEHVTPKYAARACGSLRAKGNPRGLAFLWGSWTCGIKLVFPVNLVSV